MIFFSVENDGFSLIELVVVSSILAILSSIAIPRFQYLYERTADTLVKLSLKQSFMECRMEILSGAEYTIYTIPYDLHRNHFYDFYQQYEYEDKGDDSDPGTIIGNCLGPLSSNSAGVKKVKGKRNIGGELWINLQTGAKTEKGGLKW